MQDIFSIPSDYLPLKIALKAVRDISNCCALYNIYLFIIYVYLALYMTFVKLCTQKELF